MYIFTELATSVEHGVSLRDFDASNETDGEFKKINTLGHFHLHVMVRDNLLNVQICRILYQFRVPCNTQSLCYMFIVYFRYSQLKLLQILGSFRQSLD